MKSNYIVLITLIMLNFFGLFGNKYLSTLICLGLIANFMWMAWIEDRIEKPFKAALSTILIGLAASAFSSYYFEHTAPWDSFAGSQFITAIYFFAFLERFCPEREDVEDALVKLALMYCTFYIVQFVAIQFGITWVATRDVESEQGLDTRLRIAGSALSAFSYFYGLCKLWNNEGKRSINIALIALGSIVIILMAFRTLIAGLAIGTAVLAAKNFKMNFATIRALIMGIIALFAVSNIPIVQQKLDYMQHKQEIGTETFENKNYIRWVNLKYHYSGYFKNNTELILGSGITATKGTEYEKKLSMLRESHMMWVDWGLLGMTWMVGIITVLGMLWYSWKALRVKYEAKNSYIFAFFLYLILVSITTFEFARSGNFVIQALLLYLAYDIYCERKIMEEEEELSSEDLIADGNQE